jgi:hypothetical protein
MAMAAARSRGAHIDLGVPLFAFTVLAAVFSHQVIRGLGVVVVDADRSDLALRGTGGRVSPSEHR